MNKRFNAYCPYCLHCNELDLEDYELYGTGISSYLDLCCTCGNTYLLDLEVKTNTFKDE